MWYIGLYETLFQSLDMFSSIMLSPRLNRTSWFKVFSLGKDAMRLGQVRLASLPRHGSRHRYKVSGIMSDHHRRVGGWRGGETSCPLASVLQAFMIGVSSRDARIGVLYSPTKLSGLVA